MFLSESPTVRLAVVRLAVKKFDILILFPVLAIDTLLTVHPFSQKSPDDALAIEARFQSVV